MFLKRLGFVPRNFSIALIINISFYSDNSLLMTTKNTYEDNCSIDITHFLWSSI